MEVDRLNITPRVRRGMQALVSLWDAPLFSYVNLVPYSLQLAYLTRTCSTSLGERCRWQDS